MKIAVCFSGRTRNFEHTFPYFQKNFFENNNVDIFFYGSPNKNGYEQNLESITNLYNPKKIVLNDEKYYEDIVKKYNFNISFIKMWHNIYHSNNLRIEYENENNFKYDFVFRMRFDNFFLRSLSDVEIDLTKIDDNSVAIPHRWNFSCVHHLAKCDMFSIGTSLSMNKYCDLYKNIDNCLENFNYPSHHLGGPHPESVLGMYLNHINLNVIEVESPIEFEYPDEIDIGSKDIQYRSSYRIKFFDR